MASNIEELAREVIAGKYGNGAERKTNLTNAGYDFNKVQSAVNTLMGGGTLANTSIGPGIGTAVASKPSGIGSGIGQAVSNNSAQIAAAQASAPNNGYAGKIADIAAQMSAMENNEKFNSKYANQINDINNQILNRQFSYNAEDDPTYQQYRKDYTDYGKKAMEDTYGMLAARTGGLGSSYAISASEQAYDNYMQQLASKVPELRQLAYQMYQNEGNDLQNKLNNLRSLDDTDYARWKDEFDTRYNILKNNRAMYQDLLDAELAQQKAAASKASSGAKSPSKSDDDDEYEWVEIDPVRDGVNQVQNAFANLFRR